MPSELAEALAAAGLRERFDALSFSHRRAYARWIEEAKKAETRRRRVDKAVAMIAAGRQR